MSEKVVREISVIETEDGFRIEMKGDKEELRQMIFGGREWHFGPFGGRHEYGPFGGRHEHGPFGGRHEHGPFGGRGRGPFGRHGWGHRHAPDAPFEHGAPASPESLREAFHAQKHKLHEAMEHRRRFGAQWQARWGYDLGPWWDEGMTPTDEPPADV